MKKKCSAIGQAIERLLEESGYNAHQLGKLAGVSAASLSLILANERKPNVETLQRLLQAAGKPWAWLDDNFSEIELKKIDPADLHRSVGRPRKVD